MGNQMDIVTESPFVIGRGEGESATGATGALGTYRAVDGSSGAPLAIDLEEPHAVLIVGKRGYGKSYTLGVLGEELARTRGVAPVIVDPMGVFRTVDTPVDQGEAVPAEVIDTPTVTPGAVPPRSWCDLLGLSPESGAGTLVWQAAQAEASLTGMCENVTEADAPAVDRRGARNHLALAESWNIFERDGLEAETLGTNEITVLDVSGLDIAPMNAVIRAVGETLYRARMAETITRLPWLLIDEAHTVFDGIAQSTVETLLTRGRAPGVSTVLATQRPSVIPDVGISQSDILISHRLTSQTDLSALERAQPTYMDVSLTDRLPTEPGEVVIVDDATETVHAGQIRTRSTPHGGESPRASDTDGK